MNRNKTNVPYPPVAPRAADPRRWNLQERWSKAHPICPECQKSLYYLPRSGIWMCKRHGEQWTGVGLAISRGYMK